jgi:AcrR family transcriptional regulator
VRLLTGAWVMVATRAPRAPRSDERLFSDRGFGREQVVEVQRARLLAAMVELALELGAGNVTVADVVERSGVSRRTYYDLFKDREECFLAAFDDALERIAMVVVSAFEGEDSWLARIRSALVALLGALDEQPSMGRFVIVESLAAGPLALERRNRVLACLIAAVDQGRQEAAVGAGVPLLTAEGVVGGVCSILYARLSAYPASTSDDPRIHEPGWESLVGLTGALMGMVVLPYLGKTAARKELERPVPPARVPIAGGGAYPFRELGVRLTYRTLRVLDAVGSNPDVSNRALGDVAGVPDQGQISKLLSRLQRQGLVENTSGSVKGIPNAWRLTEKGREMHRAIETPKGRRT